MAVFKDYSEGYEKDGYYVHISVPGADHPIPLQTPDEIADFYKSIGYTAGEQIPDELAWSLYELDLHWTGEGGISRSEEDNLLGESAPDLAPEDIERIQEYLDSYTGEYAEDLEQLVDKIEVSTRPSGDSEFEIKELLERKPPVDFSTVKEGFTRESKQRIQQWLPTEVMDEEDREACEEELDTEGFGKSPHEHLIDILQTPDHGSALDFHANHPWTVSSISIREGVIMDTVEEPAKPIITAKYNGDKLSIEDKLFFRVQDLRLHQTPVDLVIGVVNENTEKVAVAIWEGKIADFTAAPGINDLGRFDDESIAEFAVESTNASANAVTHSLVISFTTLLPDILEYCSAIPNYEMASIDPDSDHYELTF